MLDFVPRVIFWSHVTLKVFKMSEAGTDMMKATLMNWPTATRSTESTFQDVMSTRRDPSDERRKR